MSADPSKKKTRPSAEPKVFDVMRPGRARPSASSRPLIADHKPPVQDTTLTDKPGTIAPKEDSDDEPNIQELLNSHDKVTIEPAAGGLPETQVEDAADETQPKPEEQSAEAAAVDTASEESQINTEIERLEPLPPAATPDKVTSESQPEQSAPTQSAMPDQPTLPAEPEQTQPEAQPEITGEPSAEVEQELMPSTIDTSKMVVSMHNAQRNFRRGIILMVLAILIIIVGLDLLLDAGHATSTIPHTHLFGS